MNQKTCKLSRTVELDSSIRQEWDNAPSKNANIWSPQLRDVYRLSLKEKQMLHNGNHDPVPTFVSCHKIRNDHISLLNDAISKFKRPTGLLLFTVNKNLGS